MVNDGKTSSSETVKNAAVSTILSSASSKSLLIKPQSGSDRRGSSASTNLSSSFKNDEASFVLMQQPNESAMMGDEQGKDEEEYLEKVQETACLVSLIDDKHKDILMRRLSTLRRNREFCDVVLYAADEKEIFCHRVVLAALSPRFYELFVGQPNTLPGSKLGFLTTHNQQQNNGSLSSMLTSNSNSSSSNGVGKSSSTVVPNLTINGIGKPSKIVDGDTVAADFANLSIPTTSILAADRLAYYEFRDVDYDSLNAIVNFAYSGKLEISNDQVAQLYKAACSLRVQTCVKACTEYLLKILNVKNCIGLRKCANRTSDSMLGNEIDLFIQKHFSEIVCESSEFTSLPCIQVDVFLSTDDRQKFKRDTKFGEKVLDWLQRETSTLPEHVEFRMELLTSRPYMLYLDTETLLQDCNDLDDNSSVASCDLVQDYKKQNRLYAKKSKICLSNSNGLLTTTSNGSSSSNNNNINGQQQTSGLLANGQQNGSTSAGTLPTPSVISTANGAANSLFNDRLYSSTSTESVCSLVSDNDECEWKLISISKNSENYYIMLAIVKRKLAAVSMRVNDTPFLRPGATDRLALLLAKSQENLLASSAGSSDLLAPMADQRCNVGAVYLNGQLVVCGGNNRVECLKSVESFSLIRNKWTSLAPMLKERGRFGACICDGKLYAVGGSDGSCDLSTCECYDPLLNEWTRLADCASMAKSNNMVASAGGHVYNLGGFDGQAARRTCERYDPSTDTWEPIAPMAVARYQAGCCSWQDLKILVVGGCDTWSCLSSVEMYDPQANTWRPLPNMIAARRGCGAAVLNNKLYVAGGSDGSQTLCSVEVLDLAMVGAASWRPGPPLSTPRGNVRLVAADGRIYAVGGFSGKLFSNTIEYLDDGATEWKTTTPNDHSSSSNNNITGSVTSSSPTRLAALLSNSTIDEEPVNEFLSTLVDEA